MLFKSSKIKPVKNAACKIEFCENCNNEAKFEAYYHKAGVGLGVPVLGLLSDKFVATTHKNYFLVCPICNAVFKTKKDIVKDLVNKYKEAEG